MTRMAWLRGLLQRRRAAREIDDELGFHLAMETEANIARGMPPDEARRAALAAFGGVTQAREMVRDARTLKIESVWQDARHGIRTLAAHPAFTLAAVAMLALGIGITTSMFTIVDSLMLRPVPFREAERLAHLWMGTDRGGVALVSPAVLRAWRQSPAFESVESAVADTGLLETDQTVVTRGVATVTPGVFDLLGGVTPVRGRLFDQREGADGHDNRLLVSETLWRTLFGADPDLVGRSLRLDGEPMTVIGILPADFRFPSANTMLWRPTDLAGPPTEPGWNRTAKAYVRFASDMPREEALRLAKEAAIGADPKMSDLRPWVYPLAHPLDPYSNRAVPLLAGGVVLVFLVLCANACSLLLGRLIARRREFSMRAALGASRGRLVSQALVESGLLGAAGVTIGAAIAWALVSLAGALLPATLLAQTLNPLSLDARALAATGVAGLLATLAAGLLPAWLGTKTDAMDSLRVAGRTGTETRHARILTRGLLAGEVALACALLIGAVLLTRSFVNLVRADRGVDTSGVTTLWLSLVGTDASERDARVRAIETELRALPGVRQVAWSYGLPPRGGFQDTVEWLPDLPEARGVRMEVSHYMVSPQFFAVYNIPLLKGRSFEASEGSASVIVGEHFARALWNDVDPVGRTFRFKDQRFEVVGVAREIHWPSVQSPFDGPEIYHTYRTAPTPMVSLRCVGTCPEPAVFRHRLASTFPEVRVQRAGLAEQDYVRELERPRASAALAAAFALVAIAASMGGLFSVLSYAVSLRRREFGIRAALGASPAQIRRVVLRDGANVLVAGLAAGSLLAFTVARGLSSMQYGITAHDPVSWVAVIAVIVITTLAASWAPARSAARASPDVLLRDG